MAKTLRSESLFIMQSTTSSVSQVLAGKVDNVVAAYPVYPYQIALNNGAIRQLLLDYVECKLKQSMPRLNNPEQWQRLPQYLNQLMDLKLRLDSYIYWGIEYIVQNQLDLLLSTEEPKDPSWSVQDMAQTCMPSYWFG